MTLIDHKAQHEAGVKAMSLFIEKENFKSLTIPEIEREYNVKVLLAYVRGSHMYGTNIATSDVDITFIYQQPTESILRGDYKEQINHGGNDIVGYEIQRYIQLLTLNNPNILESLDIPKECLIYKHPTIDEVFKVDWLSKKTKDTILGYAHSQIKKATGLEKNMNNPQPKERKSVLDFCYWICNGKSILFKDNLFSNYYSDKKIEEVIERTENWGLTKLEHGKGLHAVYADNKGSYRGLIKDKTSTQLRLSSIPKENVEEDYLGIIWFNADGFEIHSKQHKAYWKWMEEKNEARFKMNKQAGQNVDLKNGMHLMRLLEMVEKVSLGQGLQVKSDNAQYLLDVRNGKYDYDHLLEEAEKRTDQIKKNFETVNMQESVDLEQVKDLLLYFRNYDNRR